MPEQKISIELSQKEWQIVSGLMGIGQCVIMMKMRPGDAILNTIYDMSIRDCQEIIKYHDNETLIRVPNTIHDIAYAKHNSEV